MRIAALIAFLLLLVPVPAQQEVRELEEILEGLDAGIHALQRLGQHEEAIHLARIAGRVEVRLEAARGGRERERERGQRPEREIAEERLEIMRVAMGALREGERRDLAEQLEHAIHSVELLLEGRRDEKSRTIRESAPKIGQQAEILGVAAELYRKFDMPDRAEMVGRLARQLGAQARRGDDGERRESANDREREAAHRQLELLENAYELLRDAKRGNEADVAERMFGAQKARLDGRRDKKARAILEREPALGAQAEVVLFAAKLAGEAGRGDLAENLEQYGKRIAERARRSRRR